jgi:hypothetical protein
VQLVQDGGLARGIQPKHHDLTSRHHKNNTVIQAVLRKYNPKENHRKDRRTLISLLPKKASNSLRNACPICAQRIELAGFVFLQAVGVDEEIKGAFGVGGGQRECGTSRAGLELEGSRGYADMLLATHLHRPYMSGWDGEIASRNDHAVAGPHLFLLPGWQSPCINKGTRGAHDFS